MRDAVDILNEEISRLRKELETSRQNYREVATANAELSERVEELEAERTKQANPEAIRALQRAIADNEKDAERWRDKKSINNKITHVVAAQLHYFDEIDNVNLATCKADEIAAILDGASARYRSDPRFYAKVTSMVAQLMQSLYEIDAAMADPDDDFTRGEHDL